MDFDLHLECFDTTTAAEETFDGMIKRYDALLLHLQQMFSYIDNRARAAPKPATNGADVQLQPQ